MSVLPPLDTEYGTGRLAGMAFSGTRMLSDSIKSLILEEQARQDSRFIEGVDLDVYLAKLGDAAEIVSDSVAGRCRGLVAFYCNDMTTKRAFITLVLVDPRDRGLGLARALVAFVLTVAKRRGFLSCRLEVHKQNETAYNMYLSLGFRVAEDRVHRYLLEIDL
jgi:ribosomal protein S18 acetylase RimI-like enzyme